MTEKTLLAAVYAAANPPASAIDASTRQTEEHSMAGQNDPAPAPAATKPTTSAELSAAFPELCAAIRAEGAQAESARIAGIETLGAAMKGHDTLIAAMKADGKTTPEQAAMRIVAAEGAARAAQLAGIQSVESLTGNVNAAPASAAPNETPTVAQTPDGWKAEYDASDKLKAEFGSCDQYVAFKKAESEGRVRMLRKA